MGEETLSHRPVIVGMGPAGLFCGLMLARAGFKPLILERGGPVEERRVKVERFWAGGGLDLKSNVQFGEGGAGTFSDGKLNTLVKDVTGRNRKVMELLVEAGADSEILYQQKPHIGTDRLSQVVACIREEILALGGEVRFNTQVTDFIMEQGRITGLWPAGRSRWKRRPWCWPWATAPGIPLRRCLREIYGWNRRRLRWDLESSTRRP